MSSRSKACDISPKVRNEVMIRDGKRCVYCGGNYMLSLAHVFVNRSHGGLGVKENLVVLCMPCHMSLDNGKKDKSAPIRYSVEFYLKHLYGDIDVDKLKYRKE